MSAYIENKHFFTKSCHRQTYQNYEQPSQRLQIVHLMSLFSIKKRNLSDFFSVKNIRPGEQLLQMIFLKL